MVDWIVLALIDQLLHRLLENLRLLQLISNISVDNALKHNKSSLTELLKINNKSNIDFIQSMWQKIHLLTWTNVQNTIKFWCEVYEYKGAGNNKPFEELAEFAISLIVLPHSNAEVKRLFSQLKKIN